MFNLNSGYCSPLEECYSISADQKSPGNLKNLCQMQSSKAFDKHHFYCCLLIKYAALLQIPPLQEVQGKLYFPEDWERLEKHLSLLQAEKQWFDHVIVGQLVLNWQPVLDYHNWRCFPGIIVLKWEASKLFLNFKILKAIKLLGHLKVKYYVACQNRWCDCSLVLSEWCVGTAEFRSGSLDSFRLHSCISSLEAPPLSICLYAFMY